MLNWLFSLFSYLPLSWAQSIGAAVGSAVYRTSGSYRRKFDAQWAYAGLDEQNTAKITAIRQTGAMLGEVPFVWTRSNDQLLHYVHISPRAQQFLDANRAKPILFLTPHIGSFEVAGRVLSAFAPMTVLFKPAKRADVSAIMLKARATGQMKTAPANLSGVRALLKALKSGESIGILPDQVPGQGEGVWSHFFGRPAYTMTLPEKLARNASCAVLVVCTRRHFGEGWDFDLEVLDQTITPDQLNSQIEQLVLRHPTQYLWGYNRYKGQTLEDA